MSSAPPPLTLDEQGWVTPARRAVSPNCDARPPQTRIRLLVVHNISLPPGEFGGPWVEALFTNRLDAHAHPYFAAIAQLRVSAHFLIRRDGELVQFVPCLARAWHAGASSWRGQARCNDFSIGVELEGSDHTPFETAQYDCLNRLIVALRRTYPELTDIAGHADIAPGRKTDPGPCFDWRRVAWNVEPGATEGVG